MSNTTPLTVSQLTTQIERVLRGGLPASVLVKGEVSNFKRYGATGHTYFTLKDPDACIDCVMFRSDAARVKFIPADGMELLAGGRVGVYAQRGRYQLYVTSLQPLGQGALELAFQQLCKKLKVEGLFEPERKKPLPTYPRRIVLVTSRQTAAVQDMLKVLRRYKHLELSIFHVPVQGEGAGVKIAEALELLGRHGPAMGFELILLGRGGGSLEDLWAFNEECVARAVAACPLPIITGIGHETDVSIADLAADYHAHTPTEAAQVAAAGWKTAREALEMGGTRLRRAVRTLIGDARQRLATIERHELFRRPTDRINQFRQVLDDRQHGLLRCFAHRVERLRARLRECALRLDRHRPATLLGQFRERLQQQHLRLSRAMEIDLRQRRQRLEGLERHLRAVGPEQVLRRGYSITQSKSGAIIRSAAEVKPGQRLITRLADGQIESIADDPRQPSLF